MPTKLDIVRKFFPKVQKVIDSTEVIKVDLTARDAKLSKSKAHKQCALAVACRRQLPVDGAIVSTRTAYLISGKVATRYSIPEYAAREIVSFDRGAGFTPGEYELRAPQKVAARGTGKRKQSWDRSAGKLRHRKANKTEGIRHRLAAQ